MEMSVFWRLGVYSYCMIADADEEPEAAADVRSAVSQILEQLGLDRQLAAQFWERAFQPPETLYIEFASKAFGPGLRRLIANGDNRA